MDIPLSPKVKAGGVAVLVLVGLAVPCSCPPSGSMGRRHPSDPPAPTATLAGSSGSAIFVHILGAVARPGLYELNDGDRGVDVIAAAGDSSTPPISLS